MDERQVLEKNYSQEDDQSYLKEYNVQRDLLIKSELLLADRVYQLSVGGLSFSIAFFALIGIDKIKCKWVVCLILAFFSFCLILHFISHLQSKAAAQKKMEEIQLCRDNKKPYDADFLSVFYQLTIFPMRIVDILTYVFLFLGLGTTIGYIVFFIVKSLKSLLK